MDLYKIAEGEISDITLSEIVTAMAEDESYGRDWAAVYARSKDEARIIAQRYDSGHLGLSDKVINGICVTLLCSEVPA